MTRVQGRRTAATASFFAFAAAAGPLIEQRHQRPLSAQSVAVTRPYLPRPDPPPPIERPFQSGRRPLRISVRHGQETGVRRIEGLLPAQLLPHGGGGGDWLLQSRDGQPALLAVMTVPDGCVVVVEVGEEGQDEEPLAFHGNLCGLHFKLDDLLCVLCFDIAEGSK